MHTYLAHFHGDEVVLGRRPDAHARQGRVLFRPGEARRGMEGRREEGGGERGKYVREGGREASMSVSRETMRLHPVC